MGAAGHVRIGRTVLLGRGEGVWCIAGQFDAREVLSTQVTCGAWQMRHVRIIQVTVVTVQQQACKCDPPLLRPILALLETVTVLQCVKKR